MKVGAESYVLGHAVKKAPRIADAEKIRIIVSNYVVFVCCVCAHMCMYKCVCVCVCVRACVCACVHTHMYMYVCVPCIRVVSI